MFVAAPLALVAGRAEVDWLFYFALALLLIAIGLPTRRGQSLRNRLHGTLRHIPGAGFLAGRGKGSEEED